MTKKKILLMIGIVFIVFGMLGANFLPIGNVTLAVPEVSQEYDEWCWAGSSQAVLYYYNQFPSQCQIANYAWNTTRCCDGPYDYNHKVKGCNKPNYLYGTDGSVQGILANWGISSVGVQATLSWDACVANLDSGMPFVMRFGWSSGGGHFLVGYGYTGNGSYLKYMDPWPGEGYTASLYSFVVSAPDHTWTHSLSSY
ncbi:MAG: C39 family peptidase [Candidatus Aminicenantes bacterium]|nr:C39 family peptidase [Candidatus Aminicenantes bacterium]